MGRGPLDWGTLLAEDQLRSDSPPDICAVCSNTQFVPAPISEKRLGDVRWKCPNCRTIYDARKLVVHSAAGVRDRRSSFWVREGRGIWLKPRPRALADDGRFPRTGNHQQEALRRYGELSGQNRTVSGSSESIPIVQPTTPEAVAAAKARVARIRYMYPMHPSNVIWSLG